MIKTLFALLPVSHPKIFTQISECPEEPISSVSFIIWGSHIFPTFWGQDCLSYLMSFMVFFYLIENVIYILIDTADSKDNFG